MEENNKGKPVFPPLVMPEDLKPLYSNLSRITHTPSEIVVDFSALMPGVKPEVVSRVIMSPVGAKMFFRALGENLARYEASYGTIQMPTSSVLAQNLFKNVHFPDKSKDNNEEEDEPESEA